MILRDGFTLPTTLVEGGNGVNSLELSMGRLSPERYESGTLCTPAIAGLCSGLDFIRGFGIDSISRHEERLWYEAADRLSSISGVTIYDDTPGGVLLWGLDGIPADDVGAMLSNQGICLRTGYHCAPLAHKALGTPDGGALRLGFGIFNTVRELDALYVALKQIVRDI